MGRGSSFFISLYTPALRTNLLNRPTGVPVQQADRHLHGCYIRANRPMLRNRNDPRLYNVLQMTATLLYRLQPLALSFDAP